MNTSYALDKSNAKLLGVCAGLARTTGWDLLAVRIGAVAATCCFWARSRSCFTSPPPFWPKAASAA